MLVQTKRPTPMLLCTHAHTHKPPHNSGIKYDICLTCATTSCSLCPRLNKVHDDGIGFIVIHYNSFIQETWSKLCLTRNFYVCRCSFRVLKRQYWLLRIELSSAHCRPKGLWQVRLQCLTTLWLSLSLRRLYSGRFLWLLSHFLTPIHNLHRVLGWQTKQLTTRSCRFISAQCLVLGTQQLVVCLKTFWTNVICQFSDARLQVTFFKF